MKNNIFFTLAIFVIALMSSCSSEDCHECHIAYMMNGVEVAEVEIGEFCDAELEDVESPDYVHTLAEDVVINDSITVPAGDYASEFIHCEEHGDHDDH